MLSVIALGDKAFGKCLGHGVLRNEIIAFIKETPQRSLVPCNCEITERREPTMTQEAGACWTLALIFDLGPPSFLNCKN